MSSDGEELRFEPLLVELQYSPFKDRYSGGGKLAFYGVRRQSEAATALWIHLLLDIIQSGVALRLPPHSKRVE